MSTAAEHSNDTLQLNQGGTAQIGQLDYEEPSPMPSWMAAGGTITQYIAVYNDGQDYFTFPAGGGAWASGTTLPNVVDLTRYIATAGNASDIGGQAIWQLCENGEATYNANHQDTWEDFCTRCQNTISWIWGSFRDGGCGVVKANATSVYFIGTYGVWNRESGDDERIACTQSIAYGNTELTNGCFAVLYNKQRDAWSGSIDYVSPTGSEASIFVGPGVVTAWPTLVSWGHTYGQMSDTFDNSMIPIGDGVVHNTIFALTSVHSPYTGHQPVYYPGHEITISGYLQTWGSDDTGIGENEYTRGADSGDNKGNGDYDNNSDKVDSTDDDQFTVDAQSCGFVTVYKPDKATLQSFGSWLYGTMPTTYGSFLDAIKKLQLNPMDGIISLNLSHYSAKTSGSEPLDFYGQASGYSAPVVSKLTQVEDCGSIKINETISGWMSYNSQTKIKVFLPYCGMFTLDTNTVTGGSLGLKYIIDVLSGACVAELTVKRSRSTIYNDPDLDAPIYRFTGNIFQQVPISAVDYSGIIQGQLGLAAGVASMATGNVLGGVTGVVNSMMARPNVETVGSCGSSYGYMGSQEPFVIIEYPCYNMPSKYDNYYGQPIYVLKQLNNCDGTTYVDPGTLWTDKFDWITSEEEEMLRQITDSGPIYIDHTAAYYNYDPEA